MPRIEIRSAVPADLPLLVAFDHSYQTNHVWQMEISSTEGQSDIHFRETRLPRPVAMAYPRSPALLLEDWMKRSALLVGIVDGLPVAYISLAEGIAVSTSWVTDLVVNSPTGARRSARPCFWLPRIGPRTAITTAWWSKCSPRTPRPSTWLCSWATNSVGTTIIILPIRILPSFLPNTCAEKRNYVR